MSKETITINDFKMWLSGVEEMQDDDWTPTQSQWKRIRGKIDNIQEVKSNNIVFNDSTNVPSYALPPDIGQPSSFYPTEISPTQVSPIFSTGGAMMTKTPDNLNGGAYESPLI